MSSKSRETNSASTAQSVTSDPKSFASDSVRKRWPVILVGKVGLFLLS